MNAIQLSQKANKLIKWVGAVTQKPINIITTRDVGANMSASFAPDPNAIIIKITDKLLNRQQDAIDQSICHEAIHGLLLHKYGYDFPILLNEPNNEDRMSINLCMTMIDDIVVNKILEENDMPPFSNQYILMVQREIDAINNSIDIYKEHLAVGKQFHERFKIFRYVMAYGFLKYFNLSTEHGKLISRFTKHFERYFKEIMPEVRRIVEWIDINNIFTPQGHRLVVENIFNMWKLSSSVKFMKYDVG